MSNLSRLVAGSCLPLKNSFEEVCKAQIMDASTLICAQIR